MFIDTNLLVAYMNVDVPEHLNARAILDLALQGAEPLRISRQVLREYLAVVTQPQSWSAPVAMTDALNDLDRLTRTFEILEDGPAVTVTLIALCREVPVGDRQIHDANIVATMLAHGERRLLTFNTADFRRYSGLIVLVGA